MQSLFNLSVPLFRAFGIQVRLHIIYIVLVLGMILRAAVQDPQHWVEFALIWVGLIFCIILLHEFGHCFAARRVGGDAEQILIWPLGGLAFCDVPHAPRAHLITTAGGPFVNVLICLVTGGVLLVGGLAPPLNIFSTNQLYYPEMYNVSGGGSSVPAGYERHWVKAGTDSSITGPSVELRDGSKWVIQYGKPIQVEGTRSPSYPTWALWTARVFWLSLLLLVFNLIPAYPLDGGRLLQAYVWGRTGDYREGARIAGYSGIGIAVVFAVLSLGLGDPLHFVLAAFIFFSSLVLLYGDGGGEDRGAFGYDFSKGYGGFDSDDPPPPRPKRAGPVRRWLNARKARKEVREAESRAADEARLDQLLEKIAREGKGSLTAEEKRFMDRVSARYRNRP